NIKNLDYAGAENDHEQAGHDEQHGREEDLGGSLLGRLLGVLEAFLAQALAMDAERLDQAGAEALGLNNHRGQGADFFQAGAGAELPQGFAGRAAEMNLALDNAQLVGEDRVGGAQLVGHAAEGGGKTQASFQADHQHVEGVGKSAAKTCLPPLGFAVEPEARADQPGDAAAAAQEQAVGKRHQPDD